MVTRYTPFIDVSVNADWGDWENYPNGRPNPLYSQNAIEWKTDGLILAFITLAAANNTACWAAQPSMPLNWAKPLADDLNAAGKSVIVSFGGASNPDISYNFSVEALINTYTLVIEDYCAQGLDFDLENGLYNIDSICQALKSIQASYPSVTLSFTLPTLPSGLTEVGIGIVQKAANAGLKFVINGMAMDYYDPNYATQMGKAATDAATRIAQQLAPFYPSLGIAELYPKVGITPMIGLNDDLSMFTLNDAKRVGEFAKKNDISYIGEWSFNRDNPSAYNHVDLTTSSNPAQNSSGQYAQSFLSGLVD
ncbi:chitinase [Yersinia ruckeri]|uniref:Chitinase n=1 Tax=Yersinia ruckeri TaxID=29486 RepID=A0A0A8VDL2_YERRU|nr:chitinase [Yersinia ruckeri]EEP98326.1 Chitinase [Yersinia ruckeri ATCC 29473]EKN4689705.1 chitinase [Yersinia ruckeri]EKN4691157.1 chitinase [Yersinia ruckeri]EKN4693476.1 chitinase [Yersinia ruckeri]EKN4693557.1 chitinase [Yersinia ruckeri]